MHLKKMVLETADFLRRHMETTPRLGVLTGTGLSGAVASVRVSGTVAYSEIPHFPVSTVQSHAGQMVLGTLSGVPAVVLQGRFHLYEGYDTDRVTFPVRVMQALGVTNLFLLNASGGINPGYTAGDVMIIKDHINLTGRNPLIGPNDDEWGPRFPDMGRAWDQGLRKVALDAAGAADIAVQEGVYAGLTGPSLETPAEVRFLRTIGADAVGFSTVMEAIAGRHAGMRLLGVSMVTNVHDPDDPPPALLEEIIATAEAAAPKVDHILAEVARAL